LLEAKGVDGCVRKHIVQSSDFEPPITLSLPSCNEGSFAVTVTVFFFVALLFPLICKLILGLEA